MKTIFIVGVPRSGTTLLQSIISNIENIYSIPETHIFSICAQLGFDRKQIINQEEQKQFLGFMNERMPGLFKTYPHNIILQETKTDLFIKNILNTLLYQWNTDSSKNQDICLLEKTPGHALHLHKIVSVFPEAKIIHIVRNPLDVITSINRSFKELDTLIPRIRLWKNYIDHINNFSVKNKQNLLEITYSDLVKLPEQEIQRIFSFLEVQSSPNVLKCIDESYGKFSLNHETWKHNTKDSNIHNRTQKWKTYLTQEQGWFICNYLFKYFTKYGFPLIRVRFFKKVKIFSHEYFEFLKYKIFR